MTYSLFTIDLPAHPIHQTTENTSLGHLQISINYPFTILLPIPTIKNLSSFISAESSLHHLPSLSISHLQLTFYYFQTLFALFFICTSLSSFLLSMPSSFLLLFFIFFFWSYLQDLAFMTLTYICHAYYFF